MILLSSDGLSTNFDESENNDDALKHTRIYQIVAFQPFTTIYPNVHSKSVV